ERPQPRPVRLFAPLLPARTYPEFKAHLVDVAALYLVQRVAPVRIFAGRNRRQQSRIVLSERKGSLAAPGNDALALVPDVRFDFRAVSEALSESARLDNFAELPRAFGKDVRGQAEYGCVPD